MFLLIAIIIILLIVLFKINSRENFLDEKNDNEQYNKNIILTIRQTTDNITFYWYLNEEKQFDNLEHFNIYYNNKEKNYQNNYTVKYDPKKTFYKKILFFENEKFPLKINIKGLDINKKILTISDTFNITKKQPTPSNINPIKENIQCLANGESYITSDCTNKPDEVVFDITNFLKLKDLIKTKIQKKIILT